jgi:hypothetical protein
MSFDCLQHLLTFSSNTLRTSTPTTPTLTMRTVAFLSLALVGAQAFQSPTASVRSVDTTLFAYVPDGFTKESYAAFKKKEAEAAKAKKNLGGVGPRGFKSRSMQSFQEAMERGEAEHLLPVFNAKERVKRGELKLEDIPCKWMF